MVQKLAHIKGLGFDFDGVFYAAHDVPNVYKEAQDLFAKLAVEHLAPHGMDYNTALELATDGYKEHGASIIAFIFWAQNNKLDIEGFPDSLFVDYHHQVYARFKEIAPNILRPNSKIQESFQKCHGHVANGIATNGAHQALALPMLNDQGLSHYFQEFCGLHDHGIGYANRKSENAILITTCLNKLGTDPSESGFVEDTITNLKVAKATHPKLTTIYIHHGNPLANKPNHVDFQFHDVGELNNAIHRAKTDERSIILL